MNRYTVTSESVGRGHPDKVCDQISDSILDAILRQDPKARVAVETAIKGTQVYLLGEVTTTAEVDYPSIVRQVLQSIGYPETFTVATNISIQSPDIASKVSGEDGSCGAGDQGVMVGYACDETPHLMPLGTDIASRLLRNLEEWRTRPGVLYPSSKPLLPDCKALVTVTYEDGVPMSVDSITLSTQHIAMSPGQLGELKQLITQYVIEPTLSSVAKSVDVSSPQIFINPGGPFVIGGPAADAGLTGRKIIVDTYGVSSYHGGGAFSGKDGSKVDRSAAYMARKVAKHIVALGLADACEVTLSYNIGFLYPLHLRVNTFDTEMVDPRLITEAVLATFSFNPTDIVSELKLDGSLPLQHLACYGHFGSNASAYPWEQVDNQKFINWAHKNLSTL